MPQLIENGMVYVVKSPLFRGVSKDGKNRWYADSLSDLESKSGKKASTLNVSRLKGHGEATADELAIYAMDPNTRKMIRVDMEPKCRKRVRDLMGEDAAARKELLGIEDPRG
jgi:DNA gyrase/topoisomerase IV subunit B